MRAGIYRIYNDCTCRSYIGQSRNIDRKCQSEMRKLREGKHSNESLQYDYNQNNSYWSYEVIEEVNITESISGWKHLRKAILYALESWYIDKFKSENYVLYNTSLYNTNREVDSSLRCLIDYCKENIYRNNGKFIYDNGVLPLIAEVEEIQAKRKEDREPRAERKPRKSKAKKEKPKMAFGMSLEQARANN